MSIRNFIGTWALLCFKLINKGRTFLYPYGENAIGYLTYTDLNRMSVHIMRDQRINCFSNNPSYITKQEKEEIATNYNGYCGKYRVDDDNKRIFHYPEISSFPNGCALILERHYEFKENKLILKGARLEGENYPYLVWERI